MSARPTTKTQANSIRCRYIWKGAQIERSGFLTAINFIAWPTFDIGTKFKDIWARLGRLPFVTRDVNDDWIVLFRKTIVNNTAKTKQNFRVENWRIVTLVYHSTGIPFNYESVMIFSSLFKIATIVCFIIFNFMKHALKNWLN